MNILIAGSNGMVGSALTSHLIECGYEVTRLVRRTAVAGEVQWDPDAGQIDRRGLEGFDGVVNMATMPWPMRWTAKAKKAMLANRLATNGLLAKSLAACARKPRVLVCASGMGFYPSSGDDIITEETAPGSSFLSTFQQKGEAATAPASAAGIRVVHLRIPAVLGGHALKMAGFQAGDGRQWMSWIGLDELASVIEFALQTESLFGPVNAVSPNPLRTAQFASISASALQQKPKNPMPAWLARLTMGEMAEEFMLASRRMQPARLLAAGYQFRFPELAAALRHERDCLNVPSVPPTTGKAVPLRTANKESQP